MGKFWRFSQVQEILGNARNLMHRLAARSCRQATIRNQQFWVGCVVRTFEKSIRGFKWVLKRVAPGGEG